MNNRILRKVFWVLAAILMLLIFYLSSRPMDISRYDSARVMKLFGFVDEVDDAMDLSDAPMLVIHNALRRWAHHILFGMLGMLYFLSIYRTGRLWKSAGMAFLLSVAYGATDEFHQIFTNRGARVSDIGQDAVGAFIGIGILVLFFLLVERNKWLHNIISIIYDLKPKEVAQNVENN